MVIKEEMAGLVKAGCEGARLIHGLTNQSNVLLEGMSLNKQNFPCAMCVSFNFWRSTTQKSSLFSPGPVVVRL